MSKSEQISRMTDIMARFVGYTGKVLPDDVTAKLKELHKKETSQLADVIFTTMIENQRLAKELVKLDVEIEKIETKLANEGFVSRAPEAVVAKERERVADLQQSKAKLIEQQAVSAAL